MSDTTPENDPIVKIESQVNRLHTGPAPAPVILNWAASHSFPRPNVPPTLRSLVQEIEFAVISRALENSRGNRALAAKYLGLKRPTLVEKWKRLQRGGSVK